MPDGTYCRRGRLPRLLRPAGPGALRRTADAYAAHYLFDGPHPARTKETA